MLKDILSISGKPGLFKLLSSSKSGFVVESLTDKRRMPVRLNERIVSLKEISVYTEQGDVPLGDVFDKIYAFQQGKDVDLKQFGKEKQPYFDFLEKVLPEYDKEQVHANEIKKMLTWYNLLVANGFEKFATVSEPEEMEDIEGNERPADDNEKAEKL